MKRWLFWIPFSLLSFLCGCSLDYEGAMGSETLAETIPEMTMDELTHTVVKEGNPSFSLYAGRAELYEKKHKTVLSSVAFTELDSGGKVLTRGTADRVVYYSDSENADFDGRINLYSVREEATILADSLQWNDEERILTSGPNSSVVIRKDDGTELGGSGFTGDFSSKTFSFASDVKGVYLLEDEEEKTGGKTQTDETPAANAETDAAEDTVQAAQNE